MTFTGIKDTDFLILNQLSDYELGKVCQVNKYAEKLCKDENFWLNRINTNIQFSIDKKFEVYSKYIKGLKKDSNNYGFITQAKNFYGFKTNFELYKFLKDIIEKLPSLYFYIFLYSRGQTKLVDLLYSIDRDDLPNWINPDEFLFHLRRRILEESLKNVKERTNISTVPQIFDVNISGFKRNNTRFTIPDYKFITELLGDVKRDLSGLPII
jgi:hypothetical protein